METYVTNKQKMLFIDKQQVAALAEAVVSFEGKHCDEVGIHFVSIRRISQLHGQYFKDPTPTDCISFPIDGPSAPYCMLGDVFVCPQVAVEYALSKQNDPYEETTLYVLHGLLHLMGYDDMEDMDRKKMRAAERRHMQKLKKQNLLLHTS